MKLLYDSSLMADDDPYELTDGGEPTGIIELPPEWIRDDAVYYNFVRFSALRPYTPPSAVGEIFTAEFDGAWEEGGLFLLTMHPHITGHRSRMPVLERLIKHMKARGKCWFATHAQVARVVPGSGVRAEAADVVWQDCAGGIVVFCSQSSEKIENGPQRGLGQAWPGHDTEGSGRRPCANLYSGLDAALHCTCGRAPPCFSWRSPGPNRRPRYLLDPSRQSDIRHRERQQLQHRCSLWSACRP